MIANCTCKHEYQDKKYGPGRRVKNTSGKKGESHKKRCTVCGVQETAVVGSKKK